MEIAEEDYVKTKIKSKIRYQDIVEWVSEIVNEIDKELIRKSFPYCGIASSHEGITLHSKLNNIMLTGQTSEDPYKPTGVTGDEDEINDLAIVFDDDGTGID